MYSRHKSLNFGQYVPNDKVLNKKVPENPRYKHVKPAIDTGKNVKRHIDELKEKQKNCHHKKDEVFNRVKFSTFIKLAITVAKEVFKQEETEDISKEGVDNSSETHREDKNTLANVLMGIGEIDLRNEKKKQPVVQPKIEKKVPYLLLDVRDRDEFLKCHIKTAKHYPAAMLSRSIGYETEDMKLYKNNRPELIILYDDDESIASRVATTLVQRGYENIYLLSGGLKLGNEIFPRALMASVTTGNNSPTKPGPISSVQNRTTSSEYFSQEDVNSIEQYIEDCPHKAFRRLNAKKMKRNIHKLMCPQVEEALAANMVGSSKSVTSSSKTGKSSGTYTQKAGSSTEYSAKYGPVTARRDSACSSKSMDSAMSRAVSRTSTEGRLKTTGKKVPWK